MCGIAGYIELSSRVPLNEDLVRRMCNSIAHRGPDGEGLYRDLEIPVILGHRRLSIIDLTTGDQPMSDPGKEVWIVFNGEIYNFPELKKELENKGIAFRTHSDTEVIIQAYRTWGIQAFDRLNGIFAFALLDRRSKELFLVRDLYGVKPLYYCQTDGRLLFGSEIKTILQDTAVGRNIDMEALNSFLTFRFNPSPQTLFTGIRKISPGHYLRIKDNAVQSERSYHPGRPVSQSISENDAVERYAHLLEAAVQRQMISDVPVGLLLSGGIDSAVIGQLMKPHSHGQMKSFTIGFKGSGAFNELPDARESARIIGSEHYDIELGKEEYLDFFERSMYYTEEPIASTTIPALYFVCRLASQHMKVVLAGQGADEPLAGYPRYIGEQYISKYARLIRLASLSGIGRMINRNEKVKRALYASSFSSEVERFLAIYTIFTPAMKQKLLLPDVHRALIDHDQQIVQNLYDQTAGLDDSLSRILYIDTRFSLSDSLLLFGDKMSMANSLEMRVPFLDRDLIDFLETVPSGYKLRGRNGKYLHKKALRRWLPDEVINRPKRGFTTPMDQWMQSDMAEMLETRLTETGSACNRFFNPIEVRRMINDHRSKKENFERHLFALFSFELWYRSFFEGYHP